MRLNHISILMLLCMMLAGCANQPGYKTSFAFEIGFGVGGLYARPSWTSEPLPHTATTQPETRP